MKLHEIVPASNSRKKKRVARGGKRGTTSGRGTKGQKSRAGHRIRPAERDLILRIPKKRGFRNKPTSEKPTVFQLGDFARMLRPHVEGKKLEVTPVFLIELGFLSAYGAKRVKILDGGEIDFAITLKDISVSKSVKEKLEKAGGTISSTNN